MILEDVRMVAKRRGDPAAPPGFRARIMRITTDAGSVETPARLLSASEHKARSEVSVSRALPAEAAMDFRPLNRNDARDFSTDARVARRLITMTRQFESYTRRAVLRMTVFQPPIAALSDMDPEERIRFADEQADMLEKSLNAGIVTYPHLGLDTGRYLRFIDERHRRNPACTTVFVLDMRMKPESLARILERIEARNEPAIVPLIHRGLDKTVPQHRILANHFDSPRLAFVGCQVPRTVDLGGQAVSGPHDAVMRLGYDMAVLEQHRPPGAAAQKLDLGKIMFYSRDTLQLASIRDTLARKGAGLVDEFGLNENNRRDRAHIKEMLGGFEGAAIHKKKFRQLYCLARMHEALNSPPEFARMRDMIMYDRLGEYLSATPLPRMAAARVPLRAAQTVLPDFFEPAAPLAGTGHG